MNGLWIGFLVFAAMAFGGGGYLIHGVTNGVLRDKGFLVRRDEQPVAFAFTAFIYGFISFIGFIGMFWMLAIISSR
jgi:hypothetical protein